MVAGVGVGLKAKAGSNVGDHAMASSKKPYAESALSTFPLAAADANTGLLSSRDDF